MLLYVLRRARASVPLYGGFDKLVRRLQKVALRVFGSADSGPRLQAALLIRSMAMLLPAPALDNALKARFNKQLKAVLRNLP
jgi:nucleolar complex protein 2